MAGNYLSRPQQLDPKDADMEMTPMIDVTFLLLIFFMCTLKFKTLEGRLDAYLPDEVGMNDDSAESFDPLDVGIHVREIGTKLDANGQALQAGVTKRFIYGPDRVVRYSVGPRTGLDLLALRAQLAKTDMTAYPKGVVLTAGADSVQADVVTVLDLIIDREVSNVVIRGTE